jgi:hypothetical protein
VLSPDLHLGCPSPKSQLAGSDQLLRWASKFSHDRSRRPSRRRNWLSRADCPSAAQSAGRLRGRTRLSHRPRESSQSGVPGIDDNKDPSVSWVATRPSAIPTQPRLPGATRPPDRRWVMMAPTKNGTKPKQKRETATPGDDPAFTPRDVTAAQIPVAPQACRIVL